MPADACTGEGHSDTEYQTCKREHPTNGPDVSIWRKEFSRCIRQKLSKENCVSNATYSDGAEYRKNGCRIAIFDGVTKNTEETEASSLKDNSKGGGDKERE